MENNSYFYTSGTFTNTSGSNLTVDHIIIAGGGAGGGTHHGAGGGAGGATSIPASCLPLLTLKL